MPTADRDGQGIRVTSSSPLQGIVVTEIGHSVAAPFAGLVFAQLGAEVIKVEHPDSGDHARKWASFAHSENCIRITLLTDSVNRSAQRVHVKHGFRRSNVIPLRIPLVSCCAIGPVFEIQAAKAPEGERVERVDPDDGT